MQNLTLLRAGHLIYEGRKCETPCAAITIGPEEPAYLNEPEAVREATRRRMREEGAALARVLYDSLPGATLDSLIAALGAMRGSVAVLL